MAKKPVTLSQTTARGADAAVTKKGSMVYVAIDPSSVLKYVRAGNDLLIHQDNGKVIRIRGFFTAKDTQKLELIYQYNDQEWPVTAVKATIPVDDATGAEVEFTSGASSSENGGIGVLGLAGLAAGAIGVAAGGGGGGSGGGGGTPEAPPPAAPGQN